MTTFISEKHGAEDSPLYVYRWSSREPKKWNPLKVGARVKVTNRRRPTFGTITETLAQKRWPSGSGAHGTCYYNPFCRVRREDNGKVITVLTSYLVPAAAKVVPEQGRCYYCGTRKQEGIVGKTITIDDDPGNPEVGPDPDIIEVWVCGMCEGCKSAKSTG